MPTRLEPFSLVQASDEDLLHRLKKEKLRLKDAMAGHLTH